MEVSDHSDHCCVDNRNITFEEICVSGDDTNEYWELSPKLQLVLVPSLAILKAIRRNFREL